ncbi:MAG: sigma-70 family RNA polymerase sigma factor [Sandaracinaceae bacterium]
MSVDEPSDEPSDELSDEALLERVRAGDASAIDALLARHQETIYRFGLRMCRDREDARDVLQETLLTMARSAEGFRGASSFTTWLYTVARSFCIKKRRRRAGAPARVHSLESDVPGEVMALPDPARDPHAALEAKRDTDALAEAIAQLDPVQREVLVLRDVEGLSAAEVAEVLGVGVAAVKSRLHRARVALREQLVGPAAPADAGADSTATATCPDILPLFSRHLEDEIDSDACAAMERHIAGCPRCSRACDALKETLHACRRVERDVEVPASLQASIKRAISDLIADPQG